MGCQCIVSEVCWRTWRPSRATECAWVNESSTCWLHRPRSSNGCSNSSRSGPKLYPVSDTRKTHLIARMCNLHRPEAEELRFSVSPMGLPPAFYQTPRRLSWSAGLPFCVLSPSSVQTGEGNGQFLPQATADCSSVMVFVQDTCHSIYAAKGMALPRFMGSFFSFGGAPPPYRKGACWCNRFPPGAKRPEPQKPYGSCFD